MKTTFTFYADSGHAWLKITPADLAAVGLIPGDISGYSYRSPSGAHLYLEEDMDATRFIMAYEAKHGQRPTFVERYSRRSTIRSYPSIHA